MAVAAMRLMAAARAVLAILLARGRSRSKSGARARPSVAAHPSLGVVAQQVKTAKPLPRAQGRPAAAPLSFSFLSLNTARQTALGGLATLLDQLPQLPVLIFLQEVTMAAGRLKEVADRLGFILHVSPPAPLSQMLPLAFHSWSPFLR